MLFRSTSRQSVEGGLLHRSKTPLSSPLSALSSLGPHDQSLFLLTELQTAWNQDEIGLQMEVNLSISLSVSPTLISTFTYLKKMSPSMSSSVSAQLQSDYFWLSFSVT